MDRTDRTPMTADERYDLAAVASAASRRNRPRHLVVFAGVVLGAAGLLLLGAWSARRAGVATVAREQTSLARIQQLEAELADLRARAQTSPLQSGIFETPPRILSQFEDLAAEAGIGKPSVPRMRSITIEGGKRVEWPYTVTNPSLGATLAWIRLCMDRIPGTFVSGLKVRPAGQQWQVEVVFARYERAA